MKIAWAGLATLTTITMKNSFLIRGICFIAGLLALAGTAQAELMVGDKAPALQVGKWVQGEPVSGFDSNHVYIVEFWATWCGPCVQSIPHLNQVWQKFKDQGVIVIGVDVWDSDEGVAPFVKKMGTNMTYRVALDDKSGGEPGFMEKNWWPRKTNHHGIPTAFIINRDGVIAWIGHPMSLEEKVLEEILSGKYDMAKATAEFKTDFEKGQKFGDAQSRLFTATRAKKWDDAQAAIQEIDGLYPNWTNSFVTARLQILLGKKKFAEAYQLADSASQIHPKSAGAQNGLAWTIAASDAPDERCLTLANTIAERAVQLSQGTNSAVLDTLARVQFMLGKKSEAIATEAKAASLQQGEKDSAGYEKTLASYRKGELPDAND